MNMSYCRFENTLAALRECEDDLSGVNNLGHLSDEEQKCARRLIRLCARIAEDWESELDK
jgi:hypothetical protein